MDVLVSGSTGFIGTPLTKALGEAGHEVARLVRSLAGEDDVGWDPAAGEVDSKGLEGFDAVIHLAGVSIGGRRWNQNHKQAVLNSRVRGTTLLAKELAALSRPPRVLVSASAVGYYGDRGDEELSEANGHGTGFLAEVCRRWEASTRPAESAGIRVVNLRSGLVLHPSGGALKPQLLPFKLGLGARLGTGRQWMSWISLRDEVSAILRVLDDDSLRGPVNMTTPHPVRNSEFTSVLAKVLGRPALLFVPPAALKLAFGTEMAEQLLLVSQKALPKALESSSYDFQDPRLEPALRGMLRA